MRSASALCGILLAIRIGIPPAGAADAASSGTSNSGSPIAGSTTPPTSELRESVLEITRSEWNGRAPGSAGADSVASYIERQFRAFGLEAPKADGILRTLTPLRCGVRVQGTIGLRDERRGYRFAEDYRPQGSTGDGHALCALTFVGSGRGLEAAAPPGSAPDLHQRVVLVLSGSPDAWNGTGSTPAYPGWWETPFAKAERAKELGAAAVILVDPTAGSGSFDRLWSVSQDRGYADLGIPVLQVSRAAAASLLSSSPLPLDGRDPVGLAAGRSEWHDLPGDSVEVLVEARRRDCAAANVVALRRGRSPETIVLAACYDGFGREASAEREVACPAANDNASGTAALLALARAFASAPPAERTLCFVAYAGRDLGGIGFQSVLEESGVDRSRIVAVLDLASLGRPESGRLLCAGGGRSAEESIRKVNARLPEQLALTFAPAAPRASLPGEMAAQGVTALGFSYGRTPESGRVTDTAATLDYAALQRACGLVHGVAALLAEEATNLPW